MRTLILTLCLVAVGCSKKETAPTAPDGVLIKFSTCLGPPEPAEGFTSAAPDCRQKLAAHLAPATTEAPIHGCLYAHLDGRLLETIPFGWTAPRFHPLETPSFAATADNLAVNFMIFREPVAACPADLWSTTCYEEPNCVFRLKGQTSSQEDVIVVDFRPRGGGACQVETGPLGGPACQGCGWYADNDARPCTPSNEANANPGPERLCNVETCQWERPRCQAHCQWGPFEACDADSGCTPTPDETAIDCTCGVDGKAPLVCNPETCSLVAQPCGDACEPGEMVLATTVYPDVPGACGPCDAGETMAVCSDSCQFVGEILCEEPPDLCQPGENVGMEVACEVNDSQGFRQPVCGADCRVSSDWEEADCTLDRVCGDDIPADIMGSGSENCGRCERGERTRECIDGQWGPWSKCNDDVVDCTPGTSESVACVDAVGACSEGLRRRVCNDECTWNEPGECTVQPMMEVPCNGIDEDCDGTDYVLDEWDEAAPNDNCMSPTVLTPEMFSRGREAGDPIVIEGESHMSGDEDYYLIDQRLIDRCRDGSNCLTVEFEETNAARAVIIYQDIDTCDGEGLVVVDVINTGEERRVSTLSGPSGADSVVLRVLSAGFGICGHGYSFTLRMPNQLILENSPVSNRAGGG